MLLDIIGVPELEDDMASGMLIELLELMGVEFIPLEAIELGVFIPLLEDITELGDEAMFELDMLPEDGVGYPPGLSGPIGPAVEVYVDVGDGDIILVPAGVEPVL